MQLVVWVMVGIQGMVVVVVGCFDVFVDIVVCFVVPLFANQN